MYSSDRMELDERSLDQTEFNFANRIKSRSYFPRLPVEHGPIQFPIDGQIGPLVWIFSRQLFIVVHAQPRSVSGMQKSILEEISMGKYFVSLRRMPHVLLDSEIIHRDVEVQRSRHRHRRKIGSSVAAGAHMINFRQRCDLFQMGDPSAVNYRHADIVNQLLGDENVSIPH